MTVPGKITDAKPLDNVLITELGMSLPPETAKFIGATGQDSGFSSRNSVASFRIGVPRDEDYVDENEDEESDDGDDEMPSSVESVPKSRRGNDDSTTSCCRLRSISLGCFKFTSIVLLLYLFICSLDLLGNAFQLLGGKAAGKVFSQSELLLNPITGLMMGILATVLLQSSSTSSSIVITMVSSGIIEVQPAIPIIMGCNIGTTVTNTLVSLAHSKKGKEFERAFSGATVHDVFNWLTVAILLPLESTSHVLYRLTNALLSTADFSSLEGKKQDLLKTLTKPLTKRIVQVDKEVITMVAENDPMADSMRILKVFCTYDTVEVNTSDFKLVNHTTETCDTTFHSVINHFHHYLNDTAAGGLLLVFSVIMLTVCLILLVKMLNSILKDKITVCLKKTINSKLPFPFAWFSGYLAILIGAGLTVLVQSSSVFTSALTPLVGVGCLKLHRMYPLTLGSNIGTTATGILAALAAPSHKLQIALQLALCHLFFNICGIALFYPIHPMRQIPIKVAKFLGKTTAKYRWFAVFYLILVFFFMPGLFFALSLAGKIPFIVTVSILGVLILFIVMLNILQSKCNHILPKCLKTWDFLPEFMRSLEPLDRLIKKFVSIFSSCTCGKSESDVECQGSDDVEEDEYEDEDDEAVDEDECTHLFSYIFGKMCCRNNRRHHLHEQNRNGADDGFCELECRDRLSKKHTLNMHIPKPIYTGTGHLLNGRLSINDKLHSSPSATPLLPVVSNV